LLHTIQSTNTFYTLSLHDALPISNAGQFQVIIGNDVSTFYNDFVAVSGVEGVSKEQGKAAAKQNLHPVQRAIAVLAEIFTPLIRSEEHTSELQSRFDLVCRLQL